MIQPIGIVMPFYNHWNLTHNRLFELYRFAPDNCFLVLINNGSTELDCETGAAWWQKQTFKYDIFYKKVDENIGFGGAMNLGAKIALKHDADILVFLSNDVIITGDFVSQIIEKNDTQQGLCLIGGDVIYYPAGWNEFEIEGKKFVVPYANGWLLACTPDVWNNIGGFDRIYGAYDFEDVDISMSAISLGYNIVALNSKYVTHLGGQTVNKMDSNRIEQTKKNREIFITKWQSRFAQIFHSLENKNGTNYKTKNNA